MFSFFLWWTFYWDRIFESWVNLLEERSKYFSSKMVWPHVTFLYLFPELSIRDSLTNCPLTGNWFLKILKFFTATLILMVQKDPHFSKSYIRWVSQQNVEILANLLSKFWATYLEPICWHYYQWHCFGQVFTNLVTPVFFRSVLGWILESQFCSVDLQKESEYYWFTLKGFNVFKNFYNWDLSQC